MEFKLRICMTESWTFFFPFYCMKASGCIISLFNYKILLNLDTDSFDLFKFTLLRWSEDWSQCSPQEQTNPTSLRTRRTHVPFWGTPCEYHMEKGWTSYFAKPNDSTYGQARHPGCRYARQRNVQMHGVWRILLSGGGNKRYYKR